MKISWRRLFDLQWKTIYGSYWNQATNNVQDSPYMTRVLVGRLRLHCFHRGDIDPDYHNHPWDFWTFPLTSYVESVLHDTGVIETHTVKRFRWHYRPAEYRHRVLHAEGQEFDEMGACLRQPKKIWTIVWRGPQKQSWGFWKSTGEFMKYCFVPWREYVYGNGKNAPCNDQ